MVQPQFNIHLLTYACLRRGGNLRLPLEKTILRWVSKVQYRKGTPYLSLIKHLSNEHVLSKGNEIMCQLVLLDGKLKVVIELE